MWPRKGSWTACLVCILQWAVLFLNLSVQDPECQRKGGRGSQLLSLFTLCVCVCKANPSFGLLPATRGPPSYTSHYEIWKYCQSTSRLQA